MNDRIYRALLGSLLLIALSFDLNLLMYLLIAMLLIEGLTNLRIPLIVNKLRKHPQTVAANACAVDHRDYRFEFEAERAWRLLVGSLLLVTFVFYQALWFFPWFMGFAIVGAGASGICPMEFSLKRLGFR
jgi:hypothetical protein